MSNVFIAFQDNEDPAPSLRPSWPTTPPHRRPTRTGLVKIDAPGPG
jgi:hypothetical protein